MTANSIALPTSDQQAKGNALMIAVKAALANDFTRVQSMRVYAQSNADAALLDWKRLTTMTAVNSPTYTDSNGFTGNGTTAYINTGYGPSYVDADQPWGILAVNPSSTGVYYGVRNTGAFLSGYTNPTITTAYHTLGASVEVTNTTGGAVQTLGFRRVAGAGAAIKNGLIGSNSASAINSSLFTQSYFDLARNDFGTPSVFSGGSIKVVIQGVGSLTADEALNLHNAIQTYLS
jgi:hypothetical protein